MFTNETMQTVTEPDLSPSSTLRRWHPKLNPYRLLVLGTAIGVGTAKAVEAQHGDQGASTTLEWISGVVIFLVLHSMSTYDESSNDPPLFLGWLFTVDCMAFLWHFLSLLCIPRPSYLSEPAPTPHFDGNAHNKKSKTNATPITLYRLIVCVTTVIFGLTKATMTYFGYSAGANWVDWALGAVVTSILFVLGMYENNGVGMWHAFFVTDYIIETQYAFAAVSIVLINILLFAAFIWMISSMWEGLNSASLITDDALIFLPLLTPLAVLRDRLFKACFTLYIALLLMIGVITGILAVAGVLWTSGIPRWKNASEWMTGQRPAWKDGYRRLEPQGHGLLKLIVYFTMFLTTSFLGCAVFLAFWLVSAAANVEEGYMLLHNNPDSGKSYPGYLAFLGLCVLFQLSGAAVTTYFIWFFSRHVLLPLVEAR